MTSQNVLTVPTTTRQKVRTIESLGGKTFTTLTEEDLKKDIPETNTSAKSSGEVSYTCITQLNPPQSSPAAIMVGLWQEIPRWKYGSIINFAADAEGYPAPGDATYAAKCLVAAAEEWNSADVGVTFKWVPNLEDAAFVLTYGKKLGTVLASAFFPGNKDFDIMYVYEYGFDKTEKPGPRGKFSNYGIMKNVFLHELGHVLGLRHEFAMKPGSSYEGGAIVIGSANPESVMSYVFPPKMQPSDIQDTQYFYKHPMLVDYSPDN